MNEKEESFITSIFLKNTVFFNSWLTFVPPSHPRSHFLRFIIHIIYIVIPSILVGIGLYISLLFALTMINSDMILEKNTPYYLVLFVFSLLSSVVLLNYSNRSFNLPKGLYILISIQKKSKLFHNLIKAICFVLLTSILFSAIWIAILSNIIDKSASFTPIIGSIFSINFLLVVSIYSYSSVDEHKRTYRQLVLWLVILIFMFVFTIIQILQNLNAVFNLQNVTALVLTIIGFIFSLTAVADKATQWVSTEIELHKDSYTKLIEELSAQHITVTKVRQKIHTKRQELTQIKNEHKRLWKTGQKRQIFNLYLIMANVILGMIIIDHVFKSGKIEEAFLYATNYTSRATGIPTESFIYFAALVLVSVFFIRCISVLILGIKNLSVLKKLDLLSWIVGLFSIMILLLAKLFPIISSAVTPILTTSAYLFGGIGFLMMLITFTKWLYKKVLTFFFPPNA